jgi:hypothetical protein
MSDETVTPDATTLGVLRGPRKCYKRYKNENELSAEQKLAIHLLVHGHSDQHAADRVHVHRVTITRWRLYHPTFQTELHRQREALWLNNLDRLRSLMSRALETLERHLSSNSERAAYRAAVSLLRLSLRCAQPAGSTDEYDLLKKYYLAERREADQYDNRMAWPIPKEELDMLRDYLLRKCRDLPVDPKEDKQEQQQLATPPDTGATP